jgi:hypothetical protein
MYMYKGWSVWSFLWGAVYAGKGGGEGGGKGLCGCAGFGCLLLCHGLLVHVLCVSTPHSFGWWPEASGQRFISPPKFSFTPEPVCLYTERRRPPSVPFSGHAPVRSNHAAPIEWFDWEECNRLGSVFFLVVLMVAEGCAWLQPAMFVCTDGKEA